MRRPSGNWGSYVDRARRTHGDRLRLAHVERADHLLPYFQTDQRVRVLTDTGEELTGTVSITTGWIPSLLLIRRRDAHGSRVLLDHRTILLGVQFGRGYRPVPMDERTATTYADDLRAAQS